MHPGRSARLVLLVVVALALFCSQAMAGSPYFDKIQKEKKLVIGLNASYPPFAIWAKGTPTGFDVTFAKNLAASLGLNPETEVSFVALAPDEIPDALITGKIDIGIAALSATPDRLRKVAFSVPYLKVTRAALIQRSKIPRVLINEVPTELPMDSFNDLHKIDSLRIGVKEKTSTFRMVKAQFPNAAVVPFPDANKMSAAFLAGKIDVIVHEDPFVRYFSIVHKKDRRSFVSLTKPVTSEGLSVAYRYGDADFARFLDGYIRYLIESGTIDKWKKQHFDEGGAK